MHVSKMHETEARVQRLLQCARDLYACRAGLQAELVSSTGLSAQGVEAAWRYSFEQQVSDAELAHFLASVRPASEVLVVLSAHVLTASLRALALALAASSRVRVLPSRRDPVLARELVREWNGPELQLAADWPRSFAQGASVHAYGSDGSLRAIRARLPEHVELWGHGTGFAVAYVQSATLESARALALDIALFDQRGCMSPRVVWSAEPLAFGARLSEAMLGIGCEIPRGMLSSGEKSDHEGFRAAAEFVDACWIHEGGIVAVGAKPVLPPAGRMVHVVPLDASLPEAWRSYLTQVVCDGAAPSWMPAHARLAKPGNAQSPPFDGPVDKRSVWL